MTCWTSLPGYANYGMTSDCVPVECHFILCRAPQGSSPTALGVLGLHAWKGAGISLSLKFSVSEFLSHCICSEVELDTYCMQSWWTWARTLSCCSYMACIQTPKILSPLGLQKESPSFFQQLNPADISLSRSSSHSRGPWPSVTKLFIIKSWPEPVQGCGWGLSFIYHLLF